MELEGIMLCETEDERQKPDDFTLCKIQRNKTRISQTKLKQNMNLRYMTIKLKIPLRTKLNGM